MCKKFFLLEKQYYKYNFQLLRLSIKISVLKKSKYHDILIHIECEETHEYQEYPAFGVMTENGVLSFVR